MQPEARVPIAIESLHLMLVHHPSSHVYPQPPLRLLPVTTFIIWGGTTLWQLIDYQGGLNNNVSKYAIMKLGHKDYVKLYAEFSLPSVFQLKSQAMVVPSLSPKRRKTF